MLILIPRTKKEKKKKNLFTPLCVCAAIRPTAFIPVNTTPQIDIYIFNLTY